MTPSEMRERYMRLKRKLPDDNQDLSKEPAKKKVKLATERKCIYSVFSCKNFHVDSEEHGHKDYPDKGDQQLLGIFDNLFAANKCAIYHFKSLELKRIDEERGYSESQTKQTHEKCEEFVAKTCDKCFFATGKASERPLTGYEEDEHIGYWKNHVWVEKDCIKSDFIEPH